MELERKQRERETSMMEKRRLEVEKRRDEYLR